MATLTQSTIVGTEILKHLFAEDWFEESDQGEVYLRYYSMPFEPEDDFYIPGLDEESITYSGTPFRMNLAHISDQQYLSHIPWLVKSVTGNNEVSTEVIERLLPAMNYILISTPIHEGDDSYGNASVLMDGFVGMLRLFGGNNLLRQLVREAAVNISSGNTRALTEAVPAPTEIEGPFATEEIWQQFMEVANALADADGSEGKRITLATQLVEKAFLSQDTFKFFSYWVALEVAADTYSTGKIITLLTKAYGQSNAYIQNDLGFQHLRETRQAVFHDGEHYATPSDVERYIQCLFLDVVRVKLGLECKGYMAEMVEAGFDVNRLDRTKAQALILTIEAH